MTIQIDKDIPGEWTVGFSGVDFDGDMNPQHYPSDTLAAGYTGTLRNNAVAQGIGYIDPSTYDIPGIVGLAGFLWENFNSTTTFRKEHSLDSWGHKSIYMKIANGLLYDFWTESSGTDSRFNTYYTDNYLEYDIGTSQRKKSGDPVSIVPSITFNASSGLFSIKNGWSGDIDLWLTTGALNRYDSYHSVYFASRNASLVPSWPGVANDWSAAHELKLEFSNGLVSSVRMPGQFDFSAQTGLTVREENGEMIIDTLGASTNGIISLDLVYGVCDYSRRYYSGYTWAPENEKPVVFYRTLNFEVKNGVFTHFSMSEAPYINVDCAIGSEYVRGYQFIGHQDTFGIASGYSNSGYWPAGQTALNDRFYTS